MPMGSRVVPFLLPVLLAASVSAQAALLPAENPVEVMVLGTFHFATPNADVAQFEGIDVLTPERQEEIDALVGHLLAFQPDHVAVERPLSEADTLQARYERYRRDQYDLPANEVYQVGFRLADQVGLSGVRPVDYRAGMDFDSLMTYASERDPEFVAWFQSYIGAAVEVLNRLQAEESIGANVRYMNTPESLDMVHQSYVMMPSVGAGDTYVGAYVASQWYDRNLRIFGNVAALAEPGDRVFLLVGQGHAPVLRQFVRDHPGMRLVEPNAYLFP